MGDEEVSIKKIDSKDKGKDKESVIDTPQISGLPLEEKLRLCLSVGEECITEEELKTLLSKKEHPICYDGFEPSGRVHIAQGLLKAMNVNKLTKAGCKFIFWVADWFALLNNKMGGDLAKIQTVGRYMIEVWKATGMDMNNVQFLWSSEEINKNPNEYWMRVLDIARTFSLTRVKRCGTIMGKSEMNLDEDEVPAAHIMYPIMQCADIFFLKADICQLGMDQRKINMLARDYVDHKKKEIRFKPIIISHHMLLGLKEGQPKMSKSDPDSAIFMEDTADDVNKKIKKAYCPPGVLENNPILDYAKYIIFAQINFAGFPVSRAPENGGEKVYLKIEDLIADFQSGQLHPGDLKPAVARSLNNMLEPVRNHFVTNPEAKKLLDQVKKYQAELKKKAEQEEKREKEAKEGKEGKEDKNTGSSS